MAAKPSTAERIKYLHINTPGYAKTTVALITLCELGLIKPNANGVYTAVSTAQKTELKNSPIYRKLLEGSGKMTAEQNANYERLYKQMQDFGGTYDYALVKKAFEYCVLKHEGQKRSTGEPYYTHPFNVALIIVSLGMDSKAIAAALLHDVVEDTDATLEDIKREFGEEVALLVDGVTKIGRLNFSTKEQQQAESLRKMLIAMGQDIRVIIIKLADRLHNMRTIDAMTPQKQRDKSVETLEIYAPIAHRLGIRSVKEELEDLALKHLDPIAYKEIENLLTLRKQHREQILEEIKTELKPALRRLCRAPKWRFRAG